MNETIKANDLRIGNLVNRYFEKKYDFGSSMEWQPIVFNLDDFKLLKCFKHKPIPITEQWLLKFGFYKTTENTGNLICFKNGKYTIAKWINDKWQFWISTIDLYNSPQYVHQLQNLYFALTSEELTIKENE